MKNKYIVIGCYGVNGVGKTSITKLLSKHIDICEIQSTDSLMKLFKMINNDSKYTNLSSRNAWNLFGDKTHENLIKGFRFYRDVISEYINILIDRVRKESFTMIFDGIHFSPRFVEKNPDLKIIPILLKISNEQAHKNRIIEKCAGRQELQDRLLDGFDVTREIQNYLISEAKENNINILDTEKDNPKQTVKKILKIINDK